ncbi:MAG: L,D-transpeptidase family protein [Pseudomonadota bacterium]
MVGDWGARFRGRRIPCAIGRIGRVEDKREGDGGTPIGVWRIRDVFWRADRLGGVRLGDQGLLGGRIGPQDLWSDDVDDPVYNSLVTKPHGFSHELLRRSDRLYDIVVALDHNWPAIPGCGSAIFLHVWRGPRITTEGCVAFRRNDLRWILSRWRFDSRVFVQP